MIPVQITDKSLRPMRTVFVFFHATLSIPLCSRPQVFYKKAIVKIVTIFTRKHLGLVNLILKRLQHRCFPVNFLNFFRSTVLAENLRVTASVISMKAGDIAK